MACREPKLHVDITVLVRFGNILTGRILCFLHTHLLLFITFLLFYLKCKHHVEGEDEDEAAAEDEEGDYDVELVARVVDEASDMASDV